jgi:predicted phosphodiesterase
MVAATCTEEQFIEIWNKLGSPQAVANALGINVRTVHLRRNRLANKGIQLITTNLQGNKICFDKETMEVKLQDRIAGAYRNVRKGTTMEKGRVIVFSDAHIIPNYDTTASRALIEIIKEFKPEVIVCNGDAFDGQRLSRFPKIGWEETYTVKQELDACIDYLGEVEAASTFKSNLIWCYGNHDMRFATSLSNSSANNFEGIKGFTLEDHFPLWKFCWSYWINDHTQIKHRHKGGYNAGRANVQAATVHCVTGHTHVLPVHPFTTLNPSYPMGTIYGVQTGCLADPYGQQFSYLEDQARDHRSGFAMLTYENGQLLPPELIQVWDEEKGQVTFRGKILNV